MNVLTSFENTPHGTPPKQTLQILIFCLAQTRAPVLFFDINRYNRQIFRHSLRVPPPTDSPKMDPQKSSFCTTKFTMLVFLISVDMSEANILTEFGGAIHPQKDPLNINFFNGFC